MVDVVQTNATSLIGGALIMFSGATEERQNKMLCADCIVEDKTEEEAITVTNGFALCRKHLDRLMMRISSNYAKELKILKEFLEPNN